MTVIPDFVANAGAAIDYAMLWHGPAPIERIPEAVSHRRREVTREILRASQRPGVLPREASETLAVATLEKHGVAHNRSERA